MQLGTEQSCDIRISAVLVVKIDQTITGLGSRKSLRACTGSIGGGT